MNGLAGTWRLAISGSFESWKNAGNAAYRRGHLFEAIRCYRRAECLDETRWEPASNIAACLICQKRWPEAILACERGLALDPGNKKIKSRLAEGLRATGKWVRAQHIFAELGDEAGISFCVARLEEEGTGCYDWEYLIRESLKSRGEIDFHVANFVGKIEVRESVGRGIGVFATSDLPADALVLVENALVMHRRTEPKVQYMWIDGGEPRFLLWQHVGIMQRIAHRMVTDAEFAETVNALQGFAKLSQSKSPPGIVDLDRILGVVAKNCIKPALFEAEVTEGIGLWNVGSRFNHRCRPNCWVYCCGNVLVVRTLEPIRTGSELFLNYVGSNTPFSHRSLITTSSYEFECDCDCCARERRGERPKLTLEDAQNQTIRLKDKVSRIGKIKVPLPIEDAAMSLVELDLGCAGRRSEALSLNSRIPRASSLRVYIDSVVRAEGWKGSTPERIETIAKEKCRTILGISVGLIQELFGDLWAFQKR